MSSLHFIETFHNSGGGVPRIAQTILHFFSEDVVVAVKEVSFFQAVRSVWNSASKERSHSSVFVHNIYSVRAVLLGVLASVLMGRPLFITPHGATNINLVRGSSKKRLYLNLLAAFLRPFVKKYHFLNAGEFSDSYIRGAVAGKEIFFSYPILLPHVPEDNSRKIHSGEGLRLVFFSRVERRKGILNLLSAVDELNRSGFCVFLDVFGPVEDHSIIDEMKAISQVSYHGLIALQEYVARSSEFDVFCLPSFGEAHSLALLESAMLGLPCLVSRETNPPDSDGIIVYGKFDDIEAMKSGIKELASDAARAAAREANIKFAAQYNARSVESIASLVG